jgi:hypothetical protein
MPDGRGTSDVNLLILDAIILAVAIGAVIALSWV